MELAVSDPGGFALKNAVRAAIVVPVAFAISLELLGLVEMALFAAFGSIGLGLLSRNRGPAVLLEGDDPRREGIPPGLAIAWAERHLELLLALEPSLLAAARSGLGGSPARKDEPGERRLAS